VVFNNRGYGDMGRSLKLVFSALAKHFTSIDIDSCFLVNCDDPMLQIATVPLDPAVCYLEKFDIGGSNY